MSESIGNVQTLKVYPNYSQVHKFFDGYIRCWIRDAPSHHTQAFIMNNLSEIDKKLLIDRAADIWIKSNPKTILEPPWFSQRAALNEAYEQTKQG